MLSVARRRNQKQKRREEQERAAREAARRRKVKLAAMTGVLALLAAGLGYLALNNFGSSSSNPGSLAPDFTLVDSDGRTFSLSQFRGRAVVLFFMTSSDWCQPCKIETRDHLAPLYNTYGSGIQIISIELLPNERSDADLNAYKATYGSPWIYARDTAGVGTAYGITALSTIVIVEQAGYIRFRGADPSYDQMVNVLRGLGLDGLLRALGLM